MKLAFALALCTGLATLATGCDKAEKHAGGKAAPATAGTVNADGSRSIPVQVKKTGYVPDSIAARPNEKLKLVFTRVEDTECGSQVKVEGGPLHDLPLGKAVEVEVTAPASGKLTFVCGMDMMKGTVIVGG